MAVVRVETNEGEFVGAIIVDNRSGPWTDGGDVIDHIASMINKGLRLEGDEA